MFIGHYAAALAAKKVSPGVSLGTYFLAAQLIDLFWPFFLLLGLEHVRIDPGNTAVTPLDFYDYPLTHSLAGVVGWSLAASVLYFLFRRNLRSAGVVGAVVFSHWILDLITHRPDLPLIPGREFYAGLGLWNSLSATIAVEGGIFVAAVVLFSRATRPVDRTGSAVLWSTLSLLVLIWLANFFSGPPPSERIVALSALLLWVFVPLGYWIDRHHESVEKYHES